MIDSNSNKAIYLQIADFIQNNILQAIFNEGEKISSVREMAAQIGVNPNTIMRAYTHLQQIGIINNKRGVGFFVAPNAAQIIRERWRKAFIEEEWPAILNKMNLLGIELNDLEGVDVTI